MFLTGPSDLLTFAWGLRGLGLSLNDWIVVLIGNRSNISGRMQQTCSEMFQVSVSFIDFSSEGDWLNRFTTAFGKRFEIVAITHLFGHREERLLGTLSWQNLWLTENGVATYQPPKSRLLGRNSELQTRPKPKHSPNLAILPLAKAQSLGFPFYLEESAVELAPTSRDTFQIVSTEVRNNLDWSEPGQAPITKGTIVAATSLWRTGATAKSTESAAYIHALEEAKEHRQDEIYCKPHPRWSFLEGSDIEKSGIHCLDAELPLELYLSFESSVELRSGPSSALLNAVFLHELTAQLIDFDIDDTKLPHVRLIREIMARRP